MRRHRTDVFSLTFGLIFALVFGWWLVTELSVDLKPGWLAVAGLSVLGGTAIWTGIAPTLTSSRTSTTAQKVSPSGIAPTVSPSGIAQKRRRGGAPETSSHKSK